MKNMSFIISDFSLRSPHLTNNKAMFLEFLGLLKHPGCSPISAIVEHN